MDLVVDALAQHELRLRARAKFSRALDMFFTRPGLEQASAEVIARYRTARYAGTGLVADLCCGIGGDLVALAAGRRVLAVDRDPLHLRMARANAGVYGVAAGVTADAADVREVSLGGVAGAGQQSAAWTGCSSTRRGRRAAAADRGQRAAAGVVPGPGAGRAAGRDQGRARPGQRNCATGLGTGVHRGGQGPEGSGRSGHPPWPPPPPGRPCCPAGTRSPPGQGGPAPVRPPGAFLLDPSPAVTRAGLVADLARLAGAWQIDERIAFLSTDAAVHTPFARTLRVIDSAPWDQRRLPAKLRALGVGAVDIRRRGLAGDVDSLHRQLRLSGSRRATVVMTRVRDRPWGLVCVEHRPESGALRPAAPPPPRCAGPRRGRTPRSGPAAGPRPGAGWPGRGG